MHIVLDDYVKDSFKVYKALSDVSRLRVLNLTLEREMLVVENVGSGCLNKVGSMR